MTTLAGETITDEQLDEGLARRQISAALHALAMGAAGERTKRRARRDAAELINADNAWRDRK